MTILCPSMTMLKTYANKLTFTLWIFVESDLTCLTLVTLAAALISEIHFSLRLLRDFHKLQ